jgi:hypothetical protein
MIKGLSKKQKLLIDVIHKFDYVEDINNFINSLPEADRNDAVVVYNMLVAHYLDKYQETQIADSLWNDLTSKWKE